MSHLLCGYSKEIIPGTKKRDDCPLVEVPNHGRLIDADALPIDIEWEDILDAPTVVEADVSEEELQREYEANVEYAQYCERYEPTYDPNTGAM